MTAWLEIATFILLIGVCGFRVPSLFRTSRARSSWLATLFGGLAILSVGAIVPLRTFDGWLGGTNFANLLQDEFAILTFWHFRHALLEYAHSPQRRYPRWLLATMLFAAGIPFFLIHDRGTTSADFGTDHATQLAGVAYELLYFASIVVLCLGAIQAVHAKKRPMILAVKLGLVLIAIGSLDDSLYMSLRFAHSGSAALLSVEFTLYYILFYGGTLIAAVALAATSVIERSVGPYFVWQLRVVRLRRLQIRLLQQSRASRSVVIHFDKLPLVPIERAYQLVITVHNLEAKAGLRVSSRDRKVVERIERQLVRVLPIGAELPNGTV